jgi:hypothetical protein
MHWVWALDSRIRSIKAGEWVEPGTWFESFADLPRAIDNYQLQHGALKRVLITTPSPSLSSLAMALGASREALLSNVDVSVTNTFDQIEENSLIKVSFPWVPSVGEQRRTGLNSRFDHDPVLKLLSRKVWIGKVREVRILNANMANVMIEVDGLTERVGLHLPKIKSGEISFSTVPAGTPHGRISQEISVLHSNIDRWKFYMSQNNPQFAFFGDGKFLTTLSDLEYYESSLCNVLLTGLKEIAMIDATRLDQLSNDTALHFINSYDQISQFPKTDSNGFASLKMMKGIVLVGNRSIELLTKKSAISDKLQIGFLNTSDPNLQDQAFQSFATSASYFGQIERFADALGWGAPAGVQIWGWK